MSVRYNAEIVNAETGEEYTQNYLSLEKATQLLRTAREGDAIVFNVVAGPSQGEL